MKTPQKKEGTKATDNKPAEKKADDMETQHPLSEKDEVKKAEENLKKSQKQQGK